MPTTLAEYLAAREAWSTEPSQRMAAAPSEPPTEQKQAAGPEGSQAEPQQMPTTLSEYLATREAWGTEPASRMAEEPAPPPTEPKQAAAPEGGQAAEPQQMPTTLAEYLASRESWGPGNPPKPVEAPLAAGAVTPLPPQPPSEVAPDMPPPTVRAQEQSPPAELTPIPQTDIAKALAKLLMERESWGTEPATRTAEAQPEAEPQVQPPAQAPPPAEQQQAAAPEAGQRGAPAAEPLEMPTTLREYLASRESWGPGAPPKETAEAPPAQPPRETPQAQAAAPPGPGAPPSRESNVTTGALGAPGTQPTPPERVKTCEIELRKTIRTGTVLFRSGSAILEAQSFPTLEALSVHAKNCETAAIRIEGHTDDQGPDELNKRLSHDRARAVLDYLVKNGVAPQRLEAMGHGKSRPRVPNTTEENRAQNRRIEISVR